MAEPPAVTVICEIEVPAYPDGHDTGEWVRSAGNNGRPSLRLKIDWWVNRDNRTAYRLHITFTNEPADAR